MRNAEEHKKLLEQIAELERDSVNYFDVEREFFLITSDNLSAVQTRFYGYSIQESGIYEEDNLTEEAVAGLDGRGCYVYVEVRDGQITIKQDLNGCWGIYLFRHGDYFALSNSFFRLLDYVKFRYPLTVNRDYCNYFLVNGLCSHAYSETAVNEIQLVDRSAILHIDTVKQSLETEFIDYKEHTIPLDSEEGTATLDQWMEFWSKFFFELVNRTRFFQADLSGGFDTRISLIPLLNSGIDLSKIRIFSDTSGLHTHAEDYEIASKIATYYGFELNRPFPKRQFVKYSFSDVLNCDLYSVQTFHKDTMIFWSNNIGIEKTYSSGGFSDGMRGYWHESPKEFLENQIRITRFYSKNLSVEFSKSVETITRSGFHAVCNKHKIEDPDSKYIPQYMYQETRCRSHYGKHDFLGKFFKNIRTLSPTLDFK